MPHLCVVATPAMSDTPSWRAGRHVKQMSLPHAIFEDIFVHEYSCLFVLCCELDGDGIRSRMLLL